MTMTGLDVFDKAVHKSNLWVKDLMEEMEWTDRHKAFAGLRVVLHILRDRLTTEEVVQLGAQLPMLIRGMYYDGWVPGRRVADRKVERFIKRVADVFPPPVDFEPSKLVLAVFDVLARRVDTGEINDIKSIMPKGFEILWPEE